MKTPSTLALVTLAKLRELSPEVCDLKVSVGRDSTGDPAVHLTVVLSDKVTDKAILSGKFRRLEEWIHTTIWIRGGCEFWPYVTLRREREMLEPVAA